MRGAAPVKDRRKGSAALKKLNSLRISAVCPIFYVSGMWRKIRDKADTHAVSAGRSDCIDHLKIFLRSRQDFVRQLARRIDSGGEHGELLYPARRSVRVLEMNIFLLHLLCEELRV